MTDTLDGAPGALAGPADQVTEPLGELAGLIAAGNVLILSGAGLSTESGIPDYRGPTGRSRRAEPMTYQTFTGGVAARRRYWARSHLGWRHVRAPCRTRVITRSLSSSAAGCSPGSSRRTSTACTRRPARGRSSTCTAAWTAWSAFPAPSGPPATTLDRRLRAANPGWAATVTGLNADGDAVVPDDQAERFEIVDCESCGGVLKPDVVFFGENVPRPRVDDCYALTGRASALLVLGSSLTVMSGYRFVRQAAKLAVPVAIINQGPGRGDTLAGLVIDAPLGATLTALVAETNRRSQPSH